MIEFIEKQNLVVTIKDGTIISVKYQKNRKTHGRWNSEVLR